MENKLQPMEIEHNSFAIIKEELGEIENPEYEFLVHRVIHTSADFEYANTLKFSPNLLEDALKAIHNATIVTDTQMAMAGINKKHLAKLNSQVFNYVSDEDVAQAALDQKTTRSAVAVDKAVNLHKDNLIYVVGNAPTALIRLNQLIEKGLVKPKLIVAVPVGFVNVVESKELILKLKDIPFIVAEGRKGGSNVAAAIINALMYKAIAR